MTNLNLNTVFSASVSLLNSDLSLDVGVTIEHALKVEKLGVWPAFLGSTSMSQLLEISDKTFFLRSVGYLGFTSGSEQGRSGFMIWSGSVLGANTDDYSDGGVGLELVGASGSLKFRTNPSVFDVQADSFFVGKTTTQFISGSGEKIEISSSNFHLSASGDVNMSGTITATAGKIGGFTIGSNTLSTTGALLGDSTQTHFISSSAFKVDHSGNVTASNIDLGGKITATSGEIGGWTISEDMLSAGSGHSSVSMSGDDQLIRFGSGSTFTANEIDGILFGQDTDGKYKFGVGKGGSYIFFDGFFLVKIYRFVSGV